MIKRTTARVTLVATVVATLGLLAGPASASCRQVTPGGPCLESVICRLVPDKVPADCIQ
jgi:hypothetical protein